RAYGNACAAVDEISYKGLMKSLIRDNDDWQEPQAKKTNTVHRHFIITKLFILLNTGLVGVGKNAGKPADFLVATLYKSQATLLKVDLDKLVDEDNLSAADRRRVKVSTLDEAQSDEADIVIVDTVLVGNAGFIAEEFRIALALSRAHVEHSQKRALQLFHVHQCHEKHELGIRIWCCEKCETFQQPAADCDKELTEDATLRCLRTRTASYSRHRFSLWTVLRPTRSALPEKEIPSEETLINLYEQLSGKVLHAMYPEVWSLNGYWKKGYTHLDRPKPPHDKTVQDKEGLKWCIHLDCMLERATTAGNAWIQLDHQRPALLVVNSRDGTSSSADLLSVDGNTAQIRRLLEAANREPNTVIELLSAGVNESSHPKPH
ncbi:hypothetical protein FSARC_14949, partial [Fusarium sarcochroum]